MGSTLSDNGASIAVDGSGNIYTTGTFTGTVDFDPGAGIANLISAGVEDIFVSKLDASGNFVWAKSMGGTSPDQGYSIAVDGSGNVYTTGYFLGTADFDPSVGTLNITSIGSTDIFVSKLDASGNFVWAKGIGGATDDFGNSIAVDGSGNVYTTGYFQETVDFDPNAGTANLSSVGGRDIFISKLSPTVLSIELINFKGKNTEGGNLLTWTTANEVNNKGFNVERSIDNGNWAILSFIKAQGKGFEYQFIDNTPLSTNYYRLRQVDNDGKETLSKVISIQSNGKSTVLVYPSVTTGQLTIEGAQSFEIVNTMGQIVLSQSVFPSNSINIHAYPSGIYCIRGKDTEGVFFSEKIIKQ